MTILPAKRASTSAEENKDTSTQNGNPTRRDHNISHTSSLNDTASNRRPFRRKSTTPEPSEHCLRKRFKVRRKQRDNRERKGKRLETPEETLETAATPPSSEISEVVASECEREQLALNIESEEGTGFNSEDEYGPTLGNLKDRHLTDEEWSARDALFARCLSDLGYEIKQMHEDGACLFRAIADQIYGDQELHYMVRSACMDYIVKNKDFFAPYVTEDFDKYVARKRKWNVHGNHLEIQALSEMYNRTIEVYCYQIEPINIFNGSRINTDEPIRLSYHRMCHYNSISNPNNPSVGVGLGLPAYHPIDLNRRRMVDAVRASEELLIEQTMLEDKIKATDWEATNEALEEEVARESYIQYFRDAERRLKPQSSACAGSSSTVTSAVCSSPRANRRGSMSPKGGSSPKGNSSPKASSPKSHRMSPRNLNHCGNNEFDPTPELQPSTSVSYQEFNETNKASNAEISDEDWDDGIMAQVLAESRNTYLDELKRNSKRRIGSPGPSTSS
ncbi:OTU domain-containing protein 5-A [Onthophagus taurus]|uniref:OTU domain-containing protein 5-A n=1 Tax=Onthophagus taurus TaxID=166361 RepID=UPI000C2056AC|nr:OTU domain-containing protein 5-A [Onthophagus taurus]